MPAIVPVDTDKPVPAVRPAALKPRKRRQSDPHRWLREARGIVAIALAGFAVTSLAVFDPALPPAEQGSPVGPVGWWLGWALFRALGYAGFLLPLLLGGWGVAAFVRPRVAKGWVPLVGLGALLLTAAGLLQQTADTFVATRVTRGGIVADRGLGRVGAHRGHARHARAGRRLAAAADVGAGRRAACHPGLLRGGRPLDRGPARKAAPYAPRDPADRAPRGARSAGDSPGAGGAARGRRSAAARRGRALQAPRPAHGAGAGLAGDVRLRQGRRPVLPAAARRVC